MKKTIVVMIAMLALFSCASQEQKNEIKNLEKEVMAGHDEVMPLSLKIPRLQEQLLNSVSELEDSDPLKISVNETIAKLTSANEDMYTWMEKLSDAMKLDDGGEEKLKVYTALNDEIKTLAGQTEESIKEAKLYLEEHGE